MYHPCLNERDTSKPRARGGLSPAVGSTLHSSPPATQHPAGDVYRATEQYGLIPTPSACTAHSLEQAPTGQSKQSMSAPSWGAQPLAQGTAEVLLPRGGALQQAS